MTTELPRYRLIRRSYIPRAPDRADEMLEADTEIVFTGQPGSNMLPINVAAALATRANPANLSAATRLAEMRAERDAMWTRLTAAQQERARVLADDPKSSMVVNLRREIEELTTHHREHGEAIEMLKTRAVSEIDEEMHAVALKRCEQGMKFAAERAALEPQYLQAITALADVVTRMKALAEAARGLLAAGLDYDSRLTLGDVVKTHGDAVAAHLVSALVHAQALPVEYLPTWPTFASSAELKSFEKQIAREPEHPAARRARAQAAVDLDRADREHFADVQRRGRIADGRQPVAGAA